MNTFEFYLQQGFNHILRFNGYDHIIFLLVLFAYFDIKQMMKVLILITAFTIGHLAALALAIFNITLLKASVINFLIPATIFITASVNLLPIKRSVKIYYLFALFFAFIHGLGISIYLKGNVGIVGSIWKPLLAFNLGIELGQIIILAIYLTILAIATKLLTLKLNRWISFISAVAIGVTIVLMIQKYP